MDEVQTWTVIEWDIVDGDLVGCLLRCPFCTPDGCESCDGQGTQFRAYYLPGAVPIDIHQDAEVLAVLHDRYDRRRQHQQAPDGEGS